MADLGERVRRQPAPEQVGEHRGGGRLAGTSAPILACALLVALQLALRGWVAVRGYFSLDDFTFISRAQRMPLSSDYILHGYNGHLMPAGFLQVWLTTRAAPYSFTLVTVVSLILQLFIDLQLIRLLRRVAGDRWAAPALLAICLFSVMSLPALVWWAAALNQLPFELALVSVLLNCETAASGIETTSGWSLLAWLGAGLAFTEKSVLLLPIAFGYLTLVLGRGSLSARLRFAWRAWPRAWIAAALTVAGYAVAYHALVTSPFTALPTWPRAVTLAESALGHAVIPGLAGGPLRWEAVGFVDSSAAAPAWLVWTTVGVLLVTVEISVHRRGSRALGAWALLVVCMGIDVALVVVARSTIAGDQIVRDYRYFTELALIGPVLIGAALFDRDAARGTAVRSRAPGALLGLAVVVAICANGVWSTTTFASRWDGNPARAYIVNSRAWLAAHPGTPLADIPVPDRVVWPVLHPSNLPSRLFVGDEVGSPYFRLPVERLFAVDDNGHVRDALINGVANMPGPQGACGWQVTANHPAVVRLTSPLFAWGWVVRIGYIASAAGALTLETDETVTTVRVSPGLHSVFVAVDGPVNSLRLSTGTANLSFCTDDVRVGTPAAWPAPSGGAP